MDKDQYLQMIENQLKEVQFNVEDAKKKYAEELGKYNAIMRMKQDYIKWVVEK